ncbi:hypothetical protein AAG570_013264 [Ranatra chinensis]|uniref:GIY-YIG domain-containing protein n=1 Tax=Ranatra chinensis TaxID=642074 RepID=A0ABD0YGK3_9HEMI
MLNSTCNKLFKLLTNAVFRSRPRCVEWGFQRFAFHVGSICTTTTRSPLGSVKDPLPLKTSGVYEIPCCCGETYIGQKGRLVSTRIQEHIMATKNDMKPAVAEHSMETGHLIDFEKTRLLASVPGYKNRIVREAIEIEKSRENFNREDEFQLSRTWKPLLSTLKPREIHPQLPCSKINNISQSDEGPVRKVIGSYDLRARPQPNHRRRYLRWPL